MNINTANPLVYVVHFIQVYSYGTVGCLRTNNKSKLNSLRGDTNGSGAVMLYLQQVLYFRILLFISWKEWVKFKTKAIVNYKTRSNKDFSLKEYL